MLAVCVVVCACEFGIEEGAQLGLSDTAAAIEREWRVSVVTPRLGRAQHLKPKGPLTALGNVERTTVGTVYGSGYFEQAYGSIFGVHEHVRTFSDKDSNLSAVFGGLSKNDVLVVGTCGEINALKHDGSLPFDIFNGKVLFIGGEARYCGMRDPKSLKSQSAASKSGFVVGQKPHPRNVMPEHFLSLPFAVFAMLTTGQFFTEEFREAPLRSEFKRFLVYAVSHCGEGRQHFFRESIFDRIVADKRLPAPDAVGKCCGKHPELRVKGLDPRQNKDWVRNKATFAGYRFVLCAENGNVDMYITEKIGNAFASGAIPVYWGTEDVFKFFNKDAFVFYDPFAPQIALDKIAELENNEDAFRRMRSQPVLAAGAHKFVFPHAGGMIRDFMGIDFSGPGNGTLLDAPDWMWNARGI